MFNKRPLELKKVKPGQLVEFVADYTFFNDNKNWQGQEKFYKHINAKNPEEYIDFKIGTSGMVLDILYKTTYDYVTASMFSNLDKVAPKIVHVAILFLKGTSTYVVSLHSYKQSVYDQMPEDMKNSYLRCYSIRKIK